MIVKNPIFNADMPDPDVILVGDTYYMVSTTMFFMPGGAILKSNDLVHWELLSYIFETIEDNDIYELKNGKHAYGKGQWATSLIYHDNRFYACFVCHDLQKTFIYYTDDIGKSGWERYVIDDAFHDMSFIFYENKPYLIYGNGQIEIVELNDDLSGVKIDGLHKTLFETPRDGMRLRCEGCRAYVENGYVYLSFIDVPNDVVGNGRRRQVCYRSKNLLGPYENKIIMDDDMGLTGRGVAQGPFIKSKEGVWYAMLFQDRGSCGRIPFLMPMTFENDWPKLGINDKVPFEFEIVDIMPENDNNTNGTDYVNQTQPYTCSDSFNHLDNVLNIRWQWNHNPINECWSFTDRPGYLRLTTGQLASNLLDARNTLTQRTIEPGCSYTVELDTSAMKDGDCAGLCAFMSQYGQLGIRVENGKRLLFLTRRTENKELVTEETEFKENRVFLKITFDYRELKDVADFYYSADGSNYQKLGAQLKMNYTLDLFVGYRIGLFNYATKELGGCADFRNFEFSEHFVK